MGFNPTFYAGRPKLSQVTIDSDLDMGGRDISGVDTLRASGSAVTIDSDINVGGNGIEAAEILCDAFESEDAQFVNPPLFPFKVVPSDSVLYESDMTATRKGWNYEPIGSIKIGPAMPNTCAFTLKWTVTINAYTAEARIRILLNGNTIAETTPQSGDAGDYEKSYVLPALSGGDVLTFQGAGHANYTTTFKDFKLCGTVITGLIDEPTFEDV